MSRKKNKKKSKKKVCPKHETISFIDEKGFDKSKKSDTQQDRCQEQNELIPQQSMKDKKKSEWLTWNKMEVINGLLAIGTFLLFGVAWEQSKLTEKAANSAIESVKLSADQFDAKYHDFKF